MRSKRDMYRYCLNFLIYRLHLKELGYAIVNDDLYSQDDDAEDSDAECGNGAPADPYSEYNRARTLRILTRMEELHHNPGSISTSTTTTTATSTAAERLAAWFAACRFCPTCLDGGQLSAEQSRPRFIALHSARYRLAGSGLDFRSAEPLWATRPETLLDKINSVKSLKRDLLAADGRTVS